MLKIIPAMLVLLPLAASATETTDDYISTAKSAITDLSYRSPDFYRCSENPQHEGCQNVIDVRKGLRFSDMSGGKDGVSGKFEGVLFSGDKVNKEFIYYPGTGFLNIKN